MPHQKLPSMMRSLKRRVVSVSSSIRKRISGPQPKESNSDTEWLHYKERKPVSNGSMKSLADYLEDKMAKFEDSNPGPLFPLSEYGVTCFMRGCEDFHVECFDKTRSIVEHCDCEPHRPDLMHRHVYTYSDLLEPPPASRMQGLVPPSKNASTDRYTTPSGLRNGGTGRAARILDADTLRSLLIMSHPQYDQAVSPKPSSTKNRKRRARVRFDTKAQSHKDGAVSDGTSSAVASRDASSLMIATPSRDGSVNSSNSSFEIQIRATTPEENLNEIASSLLKMRRESEEARRLLEDFRQQGRQSWWNPQTGEV